MWGAIGGNNASYSDVVVLLTAAAAGAGAGAADLQQQNLAKNPGCAGCVCGATAAAVPSRDT